MKNISPSLKIQESQINLAVKGPWEGCGGMDDRKTWFSPSPSKTLCLKGEMNVVLPWDRIHICPGSECGLSLHLSFEKHYFLVVCSLGVEAGSLRNSKAPGTAGGLWGPSPHSLPPERTIFSSHYTSPSEFSPRPRKPVLASSFNSSCCHVGSAPLGKDLLLSGSLVPHTRAS